MGCGGGNYGVSKTFRCDTTLVDTAVTRQLGFDRAESGRGRFQDRGAFSCRGSQGHGRVLHREERRQHLQSRECFVRVCAWRRQALNI